MASSKNSSLEEELSEMEGENQSEEDEVVSKNDLKESDETLDDPSQYYFDDDLPTPEEEEEEEEEQQEQTNEDVEGGQDEEESKRCSEELSEEQSNEESDDNSRDENREIEDSELDSELDEEMMKFFKKHGHKYHNNEEGEFESTQDCIDFVKKTMANYRATLEADFLQDGSEEDSFFGSEQSEKQDEKETKMPGKYVRIRASEKDEDNEEEENNREEQREESGEISTSSSHGQESEISSVEDKKKGRVKTDALDNTTRSMRSRTKPLNETKRNEDQRETKNVTKSTSFKETKTGETGISDVCLGLLTSQRVRDKLRLYKDYLLASIESTETFLDNTLSAKNLNEALEKEEKLGEQLEAKVRPRVAVKRKLEESSCEAPVKKDGRGRPLGWRKHKPESYEQNAATETKVIPLVKRSKKDQLLLLKALDEEMFKMDEESNKEMERISQGLDYQCSVCSQVFIEKKNLSKHFFKCLMKFTQSGRSSFKCAVCFEYFSLLENLDNHIVRKHDNVCDEPFQCAQCSLCFAEGEHLKGHILEKHDVFQCEHCEKYYRSQRMLDVHESKKHPAASKSKSGRRISESSKQEIKFKQEVNSEEILVMKTETNSKQDISNSQTNTDIKTESVDPVIVVRTKKLGRPFKRKIEPDDSVKQNGATESETTEIKAEPGNHNGSSEETVGLTNLGRGRRVKKKKPLDYDDLSSPTVTKRKRKSLVSPGTKTSVESPAANHATLSPLRNDSKQDLDLKMETTKVVVHSPANSSEKSLKADDSGSEHTPDAMSEVKNSPLRLQDTFQDSNCDTSKDSNTFCTSEMVETHHSSQDSLEDEPASKQDVENVTLATPEKMEVESSDQTVVTSPAVNTKRMVHVCPKCRKPFAHRYLVEMHMKWKHNIYMRQSEDDSNDAAGSNTEKDPTVKKPKRHRTPNSARGALFICALCPESFSKFSALDNHYQTIHDGIPCHVCRIIIKNRILLDKHMTTCHREEDRNVCLVCMKQMASKATLRKHIVMHEDRRPYECAVCKRSFRYSYDMRLHMRRTHRGILGEGSEEPTTPGKKSPGRPKQEKANS